MTRQAVRSAAALCGLLNVAPLLAWVYGFDAFHVWFLAVGLPALAGLLAIAAWSAHQPDVDARL